MDKRHIVICVSLAASLLLIALLLTANSAPVNAAPPQPVIPDVPPAPPAHTDAVTISWSSGWINLPAGSAVTLTHNLGGDPDQYHVEMWFRDLDDGHGINSRGYGGMEGGGQWMGAAWLNLTDSSITLLRHADDIFADRIRVRIWVPEPMPEYCTAWATINAGTSITINHAMGGNVDDSIVRLTFRSAAHGVNQRAYGGLEYGGGMYFLGAHWYNLTNSSVQVYRNGQDIFAEQVQLCVAIPDPPNYDSGWVDLVEGTVVLDHGLGGSPLLYRVRLDTRNAGLGINSYMAGGEVVNVTPTGANWENLTNETISVVNRGGQEQVRVRIWATYPVYLPVIVRN